MTVRQTITHLYHDPEDAFYYWQGVLRWYCYKRPRLRWLIRTHIQEQFEFRKKAASRCYRNGECICCGCTTPQLFMADKPCSAGKPRFQRCPVKQPCYPRMMSRTQWYWHQLKLRTDNGIFA